jgi:hypothetical protein
MAHAKVYEATKRADQHRPVSFEILTVQDFPLKLFMIVDLEDSPRDQQKQRAD